MHDKTKLGTRYVCFACGCKFYDLNRPAPLCPDCEADQTEAPARDIKALLSSRGRVAPKQTDDEDYEDMEGLDDLPDDDDSEPDSADDEEDEDDDGLIGDLRGD